MIEVEQKFSITAAQREALVRGAEFLGTEEFEDIYYDTAEYSLTSRDIWFRRRAGAWEMKVPVGDNTTRTTDFYNELIDPAAIAAALHVAPHPDLESALTRAGYAPFARILTARSKYRKEEFTIDIDEVRYADGATYALVEIERIAEESRVEETRQEILAFASRLGLPLVPPRGKVIEYLWRARPAHYAALLAVGVIRDYLR